MAISFLILVGLLVKMCIRDRRTGYEFIVRENLSLICLSLHERYAHEIDSGETGLDPDSRRIQIMLEFIHDNYHENLDLTQICLLYTS